MGWTMRYINVKNESAMRTNINILVKPDILILSLDSAETVLAEQSNLSPIVRRTTSLICSILTVHLAITFLEKWIALPIKTLSETKGSIAEPWSTSYNNVSEHHESQISAIRCIISIYTIKMLRNKNIGFKKLNGSYEATGLLTQKFY